MNMKSAECGKSDALSDEHILRSIQDGATDTAAFSIANQAGFERLKASIKSRGDTFDRCGGVVFEEDGEEVLKVPVSRMPATIGSGVRADFVLDRPGVSRLHCHLESIGSLVRVSDDNSTNGVTLNRKPVQSEDLCDGDEITFGPVVLRVRKV